MLIENIGCDEKHVFELIIHGENDFSFFQGVQLSKLIFLYLKSNGEFAQTVIPSFLKMQDIEREENEEPKYVKTIKNSDGVTICTLKIFDDNEFYVDKKLVFVYLETIEGHFLTIA